ncbi:MAG: hypothetical protein WC028_25740 [Candidatus Obscuribacterales bacterium]
MKNQSRWRNTRGMATWLKVVLIAAGLCLVGFIGLCVFMFMGFQSVTSPTKVKEAAAIFMTIADPLPSGFQYKFGANFFDTPMVVIQGDDTKAIYTFFTVPETANTKAATTPEQAIDEIANGGAAPSAPGAPGVPSTGASGSGASAAKKLKVSSHSTLDVAGQKMPYVIGNAEQATRPDGKVDNTFFGALKSTTSGKIIFVMAQSIDTSAEPQPLTIETVKKLTDSITKF